MRRRIRNAVTAAVLDHLTGTARLQDWLKAHTGVTLGIGLGMESDEDPKAEGAFRIGHMGDHTLPGLEELLRAADELLPARVG